MRTGNPADEPQDFVFTLFYTGGHYGYPIHLAARATQTFNISEIQHSQIPDAEGNVVPAGVQEGSAEVSGSQGENEHILVALEAGIYNVQKATCNNPCVTCDGLTSTSVIDNPFALAVAANHQLTFVVQYNTGAQYNRTSNANWSSTNTGVATVSTGLVHGVSVGSVTANVVSTTGDPVYGTACNVSCPFAVAYPGGSGPGNVTLPTATITVQFTGSKTNGDSLTFPSKLTCSQSLGPLSCPSIAIPNWDWAVEVKGVVNDDASKWTITQTIESGRVKGNWKDSSGVLHAFDTTISPGSDGPDVLQQTQGQSTIFYLDAPGVNMTLLPGETIDSATKVLNVTAHFCSQVVTNDCYIQQYYVKLVVNAGQVLSLSNSSAGYGTTSTNF